MFLLPCVICDVSFGDQQKHELLVVMIGGHHVDITILLMGFLEMRVCVRRCVLRNISFNVEGEKERTWVNSMS